MSAESEALRLAEEALAPFESEARDREATGNQRQIPVMISSSVVLRALAAIRAARSAAVSAAEPAAALEWREYPNGASATADIRGGHIQVFHDGDMTLATWLPVAGLAAAKAEAERIAVAAGLLPATPSAEIAPAAPAGVAAPEGKP